MSLTYRERDRFNPYEFPGGNGRHVSVKTNLFDMEIDMSKSVGQFEVIATQINQNGNVRLVPSTKMFELFLHFYRDYLFEYELVEGCRTQHGIVVYTIPPYPENILPEKSDYIRNKKFSITGEFRGNVRMDDWQNLDNELKKFLKKAVLHFLSRMFVKHNFSLMQKGIYSFKTEDTVMPAKPLNNIFQLVNGFILGFETTNENVFKSRNMISINLTQTVVTRTNISLIDCYLQLCSLTYNEGVPAPDELRGYQLDSAYVKLINRVFKNVTVYIQGEERYLKFDELSDRSALYYKYEDNGPNINEYYERKLQMRLRYPDMNAAKLKVKKGVLVFVPMELVFLSDKPQKITNAALDILTELKQKIKSLTAVVPQKRWEYIENVAGMLHADLMDTEEGSLLKNVGIKINDIPIVVDARVLDEPWDTYSKQPGTLAMPYKYNVEYVIIDLCTRGNRENEVRHDVSNLLNELYHLGIYFKEHPLKYFAPIFSSDTLPQSLEDITAWHYHEAIHFTKDKILFIVIVDGSTYHYTSVKYEFDGKGLPNQCITLEILKSVQPSYRLPTSDPKKTVVYNIALKINSKLGGINCLPMTNDPLNLWKEYINDNDLTMFIGIDTRLSNQKKKLGIVGITVSCDNTASCYNTFAIMTDGIRRYCSDYTNILYQAFDLYEGSSGLPGQFPNKIVIFRAGMNEYDAIYREGKAEINHIRKIIDQYMIDRNYRHKPKITYIAYHRTHNVRFYDISKENSTRDLRSDNDHEGCKWNCSPGTVIDGQITDPNCFYLISHETFLGTTKPAKYTIVTDETNFKADNLLAIVYQLCRLMSQTSRPFRRPVPIGLTSKLLTRCLDVVPKLFNEYERNQEFFIHNEFRDKPFYV